MVDDFINRKHGRCKVEYAHPAIEPILKPTYGVILYQEQVMQIAQTLAGYTLGGADLLRRAMGKKKPEEMASQRTIFITGATERQVDEKVASYIFDLMEKFAGYGFNKSHSAAYALVSYQTAWLKAHYPSAFMAAVLSSDMAHTDKVVNFIEECYECRIRIIPPCINKSDYVFTVDENEAIIYGLGAIKGLGEAAILDILAQRKKKPFLNLFEFCERIDTRKVNKRVLESLIKSGCFDCFGEERAVLSYALDKAMKQAEQLSKNVSQGQSDLFQDLESAQSMPLDTVKPWTTQERLQAEKESLGMYFTGHPLEIVEDELKSLGVERIHEITSIKKERKVLIAGLIVSLKTLQTKNGDRMAIVMFDDRSKRFEIALYPDTYQMYRELLVKDALLIMQCTVSNDTFSGGRKIRAQTIMTLSQARESYAKKIKIALSNVDVEPHFVEILKDCLLAHELGDCPVFIEYQNANAKALIRLGAKWNMKPSEALIARINEIATKEVALVEYS
jgi:DNA polymerase-3 subunit alpha